MRGRFPQRGERDSGRSVAGGSASGRASTVRTLRALMPEDVKERVEAKLSRRSVLAGVGLGAIALGLAACTSKAVAQSAQPDGKLEDKLNVYSWGDYDDPDVLDHFSAANNVRLQMDSFESNEELIAKLGATRGTSGYDIVVPTSTYLDLMIASKLLQKLDLSKIPNVKNLEPEYAESVKDPDNAYAICKNWGTTGFLYDTKVIPRELTSWADFLDAAQKEASKKTSLLDDSMEVALTYLAAHGQDPLTTDDKLIQETSDYMVNTIAPHVRAFTSTPEDFIVQHSMALIHAYNGDARRALLDSDNTDNWKWVYPSPTANLWMDMWAIPVGAQNIDSAYAFINYMLEPENGIKDVDYIGYSTGLKDQEELARQDDLDMIELLYPPKNVIDRLSELKQNEATQKWLDMLSAMEAKAGA